MIGHYLLTLNAEAEDAILTGNMVPGEHGTDHTRCLVGWAADVTDRANDLGNRPQFLANNEWEPGGFCVEYHYDDLCDRFGAQRINAAIRNRILSNQARRTLSEVSATVRIG